jgi:dipeptidyl aminopeptidase/acylaminoacyl peptidase
MKFYKSTLLFLLSAVLLLGSGDQIKSAFLSGSEIFVSVAGGKPRRITHDGLPKGLLVWSPEGGKIAFTTEPTGGALAEIRVVSLSEEPARHIAFRVPQPGVHIEGMRGVEELYWLDEHRLAVSGSLNPSTVEYVVIDIATGKELAGYLTDGFSLAVSPKGNHVAYKSSEPHFQAEDDRRPQLCLDNECDSGRFAAQTYPGQGRHVEFVGNPSWSPDGSAVAILAQSYGDFRLSLVIRPLVGAAVEYPLPGGSPTESLYGDNEAGETRYQLAWDEKGVLVKADDSIWRLHASSKTLARSMQENDRTVMDEPFRVRDGERERVEGMGATEVDFWCQSCPLSRLPRRHGPYEALFHDQP